MSETPAPEPEHVEADEPNPEDPSWEEGLADLHRAEHLLGRARGISDASPGILATVIAQAEVAATAAVVTQLQLILRELRQRPEPVEAGSVELPADLDAVRWSDIPRLLRILGTVIDEHHPSDERRREQLRERLQDAIERWAEHR